MAVEPNSSLISAPWTNGRPCTHESLGGVVPSLMLTNKSYFPVKKKKSKYYENIMGSSLVAQRVKDVALSLLW